MATVTKEYLSSSTTGKLIQVSQIATAGTLIHTAHATAKDEVTLYANNIQAGSPVKLTLEWGGVTAADQIELFIDGEAGLFQIVPGLPLGNGLVIRAFAAVTNVINISGFVNRIA